MNTQDQVAQLSQNESAIIEMEKKANVVEHKAIVERPPGDPNKIHMVRVRGTYSASGGESGRHLELPYDEVFFVDDASHQKFGAISIWKNDLGKEQLKEKDPRFISFRTFELVEATTNGGHPTDFELYNRNQLLAYIVQRNLPVQVNLYDINDVGTLRTAVMECQNDQAGFLKQQSMLRKKKAFKPDYDRLADLNNMMRRQHFAKLEEQQKREASDKVEKAPAHLKRANVKPEPAPQLATADLGI